ncbi:glycoside hydrolase family 26 protein [Nocardioides sp. CPCC 205120]|uniref:glycoside hydrolase family 26 protein n=1 Tax=Nocardioides sp. CPCC 205120 TaxID=3406462 RepID=UPI003B50469E
MPGLLTAPVRATTPGRGYGLFLPAYPGSTDALRAAGAAVGRMPEVVTWYAAWSDGRAFPLAQVQEVSALGAVPEITWEPWDPALGTGQERFSMASIAGGRHDDYVRAWARAAAAWGGPVRLRFAHESNGTWYPWAVGVAGTTTRDHVAAWRRVVGIFRSAGATDVTFVWCPNVPFAGTPALASIYPGDAWVGAVGLDGYNWGTSRAWSTWGSFTDVFGAGVAELRALTAKPLVIGEVACAEAGGDKAAWIADMFAVLAARPEIRGFTWFDAVKETDWRVGSTQASLDAFRAGLAGV